MDCRSLFQDRKVYNSAVFCQHDVVLKVHKAGSLALTAKQRGLFSFSEYDNRVIVDFPHIRSCRAGVVVMEGLLLHPASVRIRTRSVIDTDIVSENGVFLAGHKQHGNAAAVVA